MAESFLTKWTRVIRDMPVETRAGACSDDAQVTAGAAAIVDIWMGGDTSWRRRINDSDFLESADWLRAVELSKAVLAAAGATPSKAEG
jgi:hypothetical protein